MNDATLIKMGGIGTVVAAICCATPILVIVLGAVGLSAWAGYLDAVVLPILALCIGMLGYGLYKRRNAAACCAPQSKSN